MSHWPQTFEWQWMFGCLLAVHSTILSAEGNDRHPSFSRRLLFSQPLIIFTARLLPPARIEFFVIGVKHHSADRLRSSAAMYRAVGLVLCQGWGSRSPAGGVAQFHPSTVLCRWHLEAVCVWSVRLQRLIKQGSALLRWRVECQRCSEQLDIPLGRRLKSLSASGRLTGCPQTASQIPDPKKHGAD